MNPKNGICLNALHDKAFDTGLITITTNFKLKLSSIILRAKNEETLQSQFIAYANQEIKLPDRFIPSAEFLAYHNNHIFKK